MSIEFRPKKRVHSCNVQCEFYHKAILNGLTPFVEYKHLNCRFDVVLIANGYIFAIVEIKNYIKPKQVKVNTRQLDKYCNLNTPIFLCKNFEDIEPIIEQCKELQRKYLNAIGIN